MGDILEAAYFCNSRTDLSTNIQNLIKHAIMLTALNSNSMKEASAGNLWGGESRQQNYANVCQFKESEGAN